MHSVGCPRGSLFSRSFAPLWWLRVRNAARSEGWAWPMQRNCSMKRICCCPPFKSWFLGSIGSASICWTTHSIILYHSLNVSSWQESIAAEVMGAWCTSQKLPVDLAKDRFGDLSFAPAGSSSEVGSKGLTSLQRWCWFKVREFSSDQVPWSQACKQLHRIWLGVLCIHKLINIFCFIHTDAIITYSIVWPKITHLLFFSRAHPARQELGKGKSVAQQKFGAQWVNLEWSDATVAVIDGSLIISISNRGTTQRSQVLG